jgi:hypothetical protein
LIGAAVAVFVFGVVEAPMRGWTHPVVWGCMSLGVALAVAFAAVELRRAHPLLDVRLFAKPDFATGSIGVTFLFFANFGFFFVVMQYMQLVLGYSALTTGFALTPLALPIMALGATMHLYLPKLGLRVTVSGGLFFLAAGLFWMRYLTADTSYMALIAPFLVTAVGIGLCVAPTTAAITNAVPTEKQGVASAVNDTTREVGAAIGIAVAGSVLAAQYTNALAAGLSGFPEQVRAAATESLANALEVAKQLGPQGPALTKLAQSAFLDAMGLSVAVLSIILVTVAGFVAVWAPGRDGRQLGVVRRLKARRSADDEFGGAVPEHHDRGVGTAAGDTGQNGAVDNP